MTARALTLVRFNAEWWRRYAFAIYLAAVGGISATMYVVARCGAESPLRYDTLSLFLPIAVAAIFFGGERRRALRLAGIVAIVAWALVSSVGHARLWAEYLPHPPETAKDGIARALESRGVRYAMSDYWIAYDVLIPDQRTHDRGLGRCDPYQVVPGPGGRASRRGHPDLPAALRRRAAGVSGRLLLPAAVTLESCA